MMNNSARALRPRTKVVLCGGGNGTHVLAALLGARPDLEVHLVTRQPECWSREVGCSEHRVLTDRFPYGSPVWRHEHVGRLEAIHAWDDVAKALTDARLVLLGCPVHAHGDLLRRVLPALNPDEDVAVGTLYAQGGFDWIARSVIEETGVDMRRIALFGLKRFPFLCKADEPGRHVNLFGRFSRTIYAVDDPRKPAAERLGRLLGDLLGKPVTRLPHFLVCTFTLSNQVLHPGIAFGILQNYRPGETVFPEAPPFYGSCNTTGARAILDLGAEIRRLAAHIESLTGIPIVRHLGSEPTLAFWIALRDAGLHRLERLGWSMRIQELVAVAGLRYHRRLQPARLPMRPAPQGEGLVPDFSSRFWRDDIPNGLCVIEGMAELVGIELPRVHEMISVHQGWMGKSYLVEDADKGLRLTGPDLGETNAPQRYGVTGEGPLRSFLMDA